MAKDKILKINDKIVFDARILLDKRKHKGKAIMKMVKGPGSYEDQGIKFWQEHPFQLVPLDKVAHFESMRAWGFVAFEPAQVKDVEDYYID